MTIEIRNVRTDEYADYVRAIGTGFLDRPDVDMVAEQVTSIWETGRPWAAFDGGLIRGTFRSLAYRVTVPGGQALPASAVAAVTVLPTHRRRGILRSMIAAEHAATRDRGEAVALLYAAEYPIYGRFGYGRADRRAWTLDSAGAPVPRVPVVGGADGPRRGRRRDRSERCSRRGAAGSPARSGAATTAGTSTSGSATSPWGRSGRGSSRCIATAPARRRLRPLPRRGEVGDVSRRPITIDELHAPTRRLRRALAVPRRGRSRDDGQGGGSQPAERLPWLLTNERAAISRTRDAMWVRLLDVPRALAARTYEREGRRLEVVDPEAPARPSDSSWTRPDGATSGRPTRAGPHARRRRPRRGVPWRHATARRGPGRASTSTGGEPLAAVDAVPHRRRAVVLDVLLSRARA